MIYPERGASIYQDLVYVLVFVCTNIFILAGLVGIVLLVMLRYGYKSVTIKFNKRNKLVKELKRLQKQKEKSYISHLEGKMKS